MAASAPQTPLTGPQLTTPGSATSLAAENPGADPTENHTEQQGFDVVEVDSDKYAGAGMSVTGAIRSVSYAPAGSSAKRIARRFMPCRPPVVGWIESFLIDTTVRRNGLAQGIS